MTKTARFDTPLDARFAIQHLTLSQVGELGRALAGIAAELSSAHARRHEETPDSETWCLRCADLHDARELVHDAETALASIAADLHELRRVIEQDRHRAEAVAP